jgi:hypothetical protein
MILYWINICGIYGVCKYVLVLPICILIYYFKKNCIYTIINFWHFFLNQCTWKFADLRNLFVLAATWDILWGQNPLILLCLSYIIQISKKNTLLHEYLYEREVVDVLEDYVETSSHISIVDILAQMKGLQPRYYSIASSPVIVSKCMWL